MIDGQDIGMQVDVVAMGLIWLMGAAWRWLRRREVREVRHGRDSCSEKDRVLAEVKVDREVQVVEEVQLKMRRRYIFLAHTSPKVDMAALGAVVARTAIRTVRTAAIGVSGASTTDPRPAVGLSQLLDPRGVFRLV